MEDKNRLIKWMTLVEKQYLESLGNGGGPLTYWNSQLAQSWADMYKYSEHSELSKASFKYLNDRKGEIMRQLESIIS